VAVKAARRSATKRATQRAPKKSAPSRGAKSQPPAKNAAKRRVKESAAGLRARAERLLRELQGTYPDAGCALKHGSALELLIATILSAQCTDERVNIVMPDVMRRWPTIAALAAAEPAELENAIHSTGFFRNKTKSLLGMAQRIRDAYGGNVPETMAELLTLPGVARKTANCVLGTWFGQNVGIVVDTHVGRVAERLGLLRTARDAKDAVKIEQDLMPLFPRQMWTWLSHALILHGRQICHARKPKCETCPLASDCPSAGVVGE